MSWLHRIRSLWRSRKLDRDLNDELDFHIEMRTREHITSGLTPDDARRRAQLQFGNSALIKDRTRDRNIVTWLETWVQDLRYAARSLRRNPAFAGMAIVVLALGIGANSAMFSVVNAVMLKPLPYAQPERLFWLTTHSARLNLDIASAPHYWLWRAQSQLFENAAAYNDQSFNLVDREAERVDCAMVSASFLPTLGVQPVLGRGFAEDEDRPGGPRAAVLTHAFFERKYRGDAGVLGKTLNLDDQLYTIVGVMGADFRFPEAGDFDMLLPLALPQALGRGPALIVNILARAKPGITLERARGDLDRVNAQTLNSGFRSPPMRVSRLDRERVGEQRTMLLVLLGAVGFVLLIACGNVANLLLGRAAARQREVAVRAALGAGRRRLLRQFLTESLLLSLLGAGLGLVAARYAILGLISLGGARVPFIEQTRIDPLVLWFTAALAILAGLIFGAAPSLTSSRLGFFEMLKRGGISSTAPRAQRQFRAALVIAEIALALVLMAGAGLTIKSLWILQNRDPGFEPENLLLAELNPNHQRYASNSRRQALYHEISEKLESVPGIAGAGLYANGYMRGGLGIKGRPAPPPGSPFLTYVPATPDFFRAMGIRLEKGSLFSDGDPSCFADLNEAAARAFFPNGDAVGSAFEWGMNSLITCTITGIVSNSSDNGLAEEVPPTVYVPIAKLNALPPTEVTIALRAKGDPLALASIVRDQVRAIDADQALYRIRTMEQKLSASIAPRKFSMILLSAFAGLALTLAIAGIYAVMFASVAERTHEVGIRMALGARRGDVLRMIAGVGARLIAAGLILGMAGAWGATRLLKSQLYHVSTLDPWMFALVPLLLAVTAMIASVVPAIRATRVDPVIALRQE